ncbi:MAG TPA: hypothetical protein VK464_03285 [Symbiobacteriaceae bacterium]|jgi:hypothetical protein|nr:hypothetical protein [Symbiobacteriaceae bacterium]
MPAYITFGIFEVQELDDSEANFAEVITISPLLHTKRNDGYGFNIGDFKYVPSWGVIYDNDVIDHPRWTPLWRPAAGSGA